MDDNKPDHFPSLQFSSRDLPTPRFSRPQDIRGGNSKLVRSIAWSCDGQYVATGTEFKGLRVWDARSTIEAQSSFPLPSSSRSSPHAGHVAALAFSPVEPRILVSGCKSSAGGAVVAIWDIRSPNSPISTHKISGDVLSISFHPSGKQFAVVCPKSRDEVFFFWKVEKEGKEVWEAREDVGMGGPSVDIGSEEINSLRFSNSGKLISAVSNDGSITSWIFPLSPREVASSISVGKEDEPLSGKSRVATPREGTPEGEEVVEAAVRESEGVAEIGGPDETGHAEGEGENRHTESAIEIVQAEGENGHTEDIPETADSLDVQTIPEPEGKPVDGDIEMTETVPTPNDIISTVPLPSAKTRKLPTLTLSTQNPSTEIETERRKAKQLVRFRRSLAHSASLLSLSYDPSGRFFCAGGQDALLSLFDTRDWICVRTFDACTAAIRHSAFSPDGELIAVGGDDNYIAIISVHSGVVVGKCPIQGNLNALAWHPVDNVLAYSTNLKTAVVWHLVSQE